MPNLKRFIEPSNKMYEIALDEIKGGKKQSHYMWFIFPQLKGLGKTTTSEYYGIENLEEAKAYLKHPILGKRLIEITTALLHVENKTAFEIFGTPDYLKLKSCMTLFNLTNPNEKVFKKVIDKYYNGYEDEITKLLIDN